MNGLFFGPAVGLKVCPTNGAFTYFPVGANELEENSSFPHCKLRWIVSASVEES